MLFRSLPGYIDCSSKDSIKDGTCPRWHKVLVVQMDPLVVILLEHLKDGEEQIEDVEVKLNRRPDVLVIRVTFYQVLSVVDDEA